MDKKLEISRNCAALRAVMQYRKVTMADIAKGTGLSYRSIEGYYYGRNDMAHGRAYNIVEIEHFLDIDGRILTGSKSIDTFYEAEDRKLKGHDSGPDLHQTCICEEIATYALTEKKDALARMMAYYKALMDGHDPDEDDVPEGDVQPWKM